MNRPTGVSILGWLAVAFGVLGVGASILGVISAFGLMALGAGVAGLGEVGGGGSVVGGALLVLLLSAWAGILSAIELTFGIGALQLRPWAWTLGMVWTWVSIASNLFSLVANRGDGFFGTLIGIAVAVAILYYLFTDEVRAAFGKTDKEPPSFMVPVFEQIAKLVSSSSTQPVAQPQPPAGVAPMAPPAPAPEAKAEVPAPPAPPAPPAV